MFISLDDNRLTNISTEVFAKLPALEQLYLRRNQIESVDFSLEPAGIFSKLHLLILDDNKIEDLEENCFSKLTSLLVLTLNNNRLKKLEAKVFKPTFPLVLFDVRNNKIEEIERKLFTEKTLNMDFKATGNVCFNEDVKIDGNFDMEKLKACFNSSGVFKVNVLLVVAMVLAALMMAS
jgi:Leucine-rich repeat (LRR) protein